MTATCPRCTSKTGSDGLCHRCLLQVGIELKHANNAMVGDAHIPTIEELRKSFPHLEIKRLVGRGGMGAIYQARQTGLDRDVAIKIIDRRISKEGPFLDRFDREARALAKLSHPNIVTVYDYGQTDDGLAYLVMEYVNGLNLREAMESMSIDAHEAVEYIKTMCSALYYAHSKGVVHRDIKPENILLGDDGSLKIADFGIAKIVDAHSPKQATATRQVLGTPHYLAPEQLASPNEADHRVDIYAVGVVFYELLTRQLPVGTFEAPSQVNSVLDQRYDAIVARSLNRRPTARYQSAEELRKALELVGSGAAATYEVVDIPDPFDQLAPASVPFECDDMSGFAQALGTIQANQNGMLVEYHVCDNIWGTIMSRLHSISIPWNRIVGVEYQRGTFSGKFAIVGDSISALQKFPRAESGRIEVTVKKSNSQLAERVIERVRALRPQVISSIPNLFTQSAKANFALAILLVFFSVFNAGLLAIAQILGAYHLNGWMLAVSAIACTVLLVPLIVVQLVAGISHAATGSRTAAKIGVMTTMLPVSPFVLLGIPFGLWARNALVESDAVASNAKREPVSKGWGATTLVFMRDSRNARVISLLETIGGLVVFGGIGLFWFGFYPVMMNYRVVGEVNNAALSKDLSVTKEVVIQNSMDARLQGLNVVHYFNAGGGLTIRCWQFQRQNISERLSVSRPPIIQFTADSESTSQDSQQSYSPILTGIPVDDVMSRGTPTGPEVLCAGKGMVVESAWVAGVELAKPDQLRVILSNRGDEEFRKFAKEHDDSSRLGLVVDGWIAGLSFEPVRDRRMTFRMSTESKLSLKSIQAAIRGPALPCELELLD